MINLWFFLIFLLISSEFSTAQKTSICYKTGNVINENGANEKSMCLVKTSKTQNNARLFCKKNGMNLFNPATSKDAASELSKFVKSVFKGQVKNRAVIARKGSTCQIINGAGKISSASCGISAQFICEFQYQNFGFLPRPGECGLNTMNRILGGEAAGLREFPWLMTLVSVRDDMTVDTDCGGALISDRYAITAAHCIGSVEKTNVKALRIGEYDKSTNQDCIGEDCNAPAFEVEIEEIILHENYENIHFFNDIALIRLAETVDFSGSIKPLCLPVDDALKKLDYTNKTLTVAGWGYTADGGPVSDRLLKVNVQGTSFKQCNDSWGGVTYKQVCTQGVEGKGSCNGDSGGPLIRYNFASVPPYWYEVGLVSYGFCGREGSPVVFTKISEYISWIVENVKP